MASADPIEISDEDEPTVTNNSTVAEPGSRMNRFDSLRSSEEYDYDPEEDDVDLNDVSLHASDIEEGDIFAEDLKRYTELQRQTAERLAAEPVPRSPTPPAGAGKRPAQETNGPVKRSRTESEAEEDDDDELDLEKLLATSPVVPTSPAARTTRRTRSGRTRDQNAPVLQVSDTEDEKLVLSQTPSLPPEESSAVLEETEPTLTARVQAGRLIIRLQMTPTERLERLFEAVADELSLPVRRVCLGQRDVIYSPHQTPEDVGLGPFDMIEFWEGVSAPAPAPVAAAPDPDSIELKVQSADRRSTVIIRLGRTEAMSVLMKRYAVEKGVKLDELRFRFDGEALEPSDTPETLDLEGGECIDVHSR